MKIIKYPDGSSYVEIPSDYKEALSESYKITHRINSYEDLWHLGQLLDAFNFKEISPRVFIPNLIDAQADMRFGNYNQSSGLRLVTKFLNQFDALYEIFHPHNPAVLEALLDNVIIRNNSEFIQKVLIQLGMYLPKHNTKNKIYKSDLILMSPDAGAFKPLMKLSNEIKWQGETYSASKYREPGTGKLTQLVDRQDFEGKDVLIIDDICVYGGTFKGLAKILKEKNIGKLYLAVSHMTIQNHKDNELFTLFDKVFTTNSKYDNYFIPSKEGGIQPTNLEIIKPFNI